MYRIAVIENETELQKYGHTNVLRNLSKCLSAQECKYYKFNSFTSANIWELFLNGNNILTYDAVFLSTNACNDTVVYKCLKENKDLIIEFIENGGGIYVGYQKNLNEVIEQNSTLDDYYSKINQTETQNSFSFLPESYQFRLIEEYKFDKQIPETSLTDLRENENEKLNIKIKTKSSSEGEIKIDDTNRKDIILQYPETITNQNEILKKCRSNAFQNHLYKSSIFPTLRGSYVALLFDNDPIYPDEVVNEKIKKVFPYRKRILLARAVSKKNEKIVVSSMAIDWENHKNLLRNILEYITKGVPKHAFIKSEEDVNNSEFNYLVNSAIISKISCAVYNSSDKISAEMRLIHDVYFFSPSIDEKEVDSYWSKLKILKAKKKVYHLLSNKNENSELVLKQYSNSSSLDNIKINVLSWLDNYYAQHQKKYWDGFWVTYDTLMMMYVSSLDYKPYLDGIYYEISKHRQDGSSYDKLIGCTIGMLKLYYYFWPEKTNEISNITNWILQKIFQQSDLPQIEYMPISYYEKESFLITFYELSRMTNCNQQIDSSIFNTKEYKKLIEEVYNNFIFNYNDQDCTEIDLCRHIQFCVYFEKPFDGLLGSLMSKRDIDGKWVGVGRTSGVIVHLLEVLNKEQIIEKNLNKKLEETINYILDEYDLVNCNWNNLVLDSVRSIGALSLYDSLFSLSKKDFFESVKNEAEQIGYNNIIESSFKLSSSLQKRIFSLEQKCLNLNNKIELLEKENIELNNNCSSLTLKNENELKKYNFDRNKFEKIWRLLTGLSLFLGLITVGLVIFIVIDMQSGAALFTQVGSVIGLAISLFISFIAEEFLHRKIFSGENKRKKKGKKND